MKKLSLFMLVILMGLVLLPICPIQFQIRQEVTHSGRKIYPVYERKLPFLKWKEAFSNPESEGEAKNWIRRQQHWFPLLAYCAIAGKFLPLDALPVPRA